MAVHMIHNYVLRYDLDEERAWVIFHYKVGQSMEECELVSTQRKRGVFS